MPRFLIRTHAFFRVPWSSIKSVAYVRDYGLEYVGPPKNKRGLTHFFFGNETYLVTPSGPSLPPGPYLILGEVND